MDTAWCKERLTRYLNHLRMLHKEEQRYSHDFMYDIESLTNIKSHISQLSTTVQAIYRFLSPDGSDFYEDASYITEIRIEQASRAIGAVEDYDILREKLAPESPALAADQMHPWTWEPVRQLWEIRHFQEALHAAARSINAHVQSKVGRRNLASDVQLIQECFSDKPPEPGKPRLRFPGDPSDPTVQNYQQGTRDLALGYIRAIRNPTAHLATHETEDLNEQEALEQLATLSTAARFLERCKVVNADDESDHT